MLACGTSFSGTFSELTDFGKAGAHQNCSRNISGSATFRALGSSAWLGVDCQKAKPFRLELATRIQDGPHDAPRSRTGQSARRPQHVGNPRKSRPSRGALRRHVSRQVLVELRSHHSCGLLVERCPTLAWVHRTLLSRLEVYPRCP